MRSHSVAQAPWFESLDDCGRALYYYEDKPVPGGILFTQPPPSFHYEFSFTKFMGSVEGRGLILFICCGLTGLVIAVSAEVSLQRKTGAYW